MHSLHAKQRQARKHFLYKVLLPLIALFVLGALLWFTPHSPEIKPAAWHLFAVFLTTIVGVVLKPLPIGVLALFALSIVTVTHTMPLDDVLKGFSNSVVWLVLLAFFIARGFIATGLGMRIAYGFVVLFGKRTLGLSYSLLATELILAPAIPSVTARAGGVIFPVVKSLAQLFGSDPQTFTGRRIGSFLIKVAYQGSVITSAMFLTAMAANPILVSLTGQAGFGISWGQWALAAILPGIISLIAMPYLVYKIYPPEIKETPDAPVMARGKLAEMGPLKRSEWIMLGVFALLIVMWVFGTYLNIHATTTAFIGVSLLLLTGVIHWNDVVQEDKAWDTFIWFSTLITLASALNTLGLTPWFSGQIVNWVGNLSWVSAFSILALVYFYSHYFFASNLAHVGAMYPAFLLVAISVGTPPVLAILVLAFSSSLFGGLTHYGSGPAPLFFGSGYVPVQKWWMVGFVVSILNLIIWVGLGSLWWKALGLW